MSAAFKFPNNYNSRGFDPAYIRDDRGTDGATLDWSGTWDTQNQDMVDRIEDVISTFSSYQLIAGYLPSDDATKSTTIYNPYINDHTVVPTDTPYSTKVSTSASIGVRNCLARTISALWTNYYRPLQDSEIFISTSSYDYRPTRTLFAYEPQVIGEMKKHSFYLHKIYRSGTNDGSGGYLASAGDGKYYVICSPTYDVDGVLDDNSTYGPHGAYNRMCFDFTSTAFTGLNGDTWYVKRSNDLVGVNAAYTNAVVLQLFSNAACTTPVQPANGSALGEFGTGTTADYAIASTNLKGTSTPQEYIYRMIKAHINWRGLHRYTYTDSEGATRNGALIKTGENNASSRNYAQFAGKLNDFLGSGGWDSYTYNSVTNYSGSTDVGSETGINQDAYDEADELGLAYGGTDNGLWSCYTAFTQCYVNNNGSVHTGVDNDGRLRRITVDQRWPGRYSTSDPIALVVRSPSSEYTAPTPTDSVREDTEWFTAEYLVNNSSSDLQNRLWPDHINPSAITWTIEQATSTNDSQSLVRHRRTNGAYRMKFKLQYAPMSKENFNTFFNFIMSMKGAYQSFYWRIKHSANYDTRPDMRLVRGNQARYHNSAVQAYKTMSGGDAILYLDGFEPSQSESIKAGEFIISRAFKTNGDIGVSAQTQSSNKFGECVFRTTHPLQQQITRGDFLYLDPYWIKVALDISNLEVDINTVQLYGFEVTFVAVVD